MNFFIVLWVAIVIVGVILITHEARGLSGCDTGLLSFLLVILIAIVGGFVSLVVSGIVDGAIYSVCKDKLEHKIEIQYIYSVVDDNDNFVLGTTLSKNNNLVHYYYIKNEDGTYKTEETYCNSIELNDNVEPQLKEEYEEYDNKILTFFSLNKKRDIKRKLILPTNTIEGAKYE